MLLILFFWSWLFGDQQEAPSRAKTRAMPEICDNGIDDDMDGLIDLNDTIDCKCNGIETIQFKPSSLIPNPSFEDTLCCPDGLAQLNCAVDWIQASSATSDYYHTCGLSEDPERGYPPMPLPDGNGYIGFIDLTRILLGPYKEYVGACLLEPMKAGTEYTLQFYLGFGRAGNRYSSRSPMPVALFGTADCGQLPFGGRRYDGCPGALPSWFEIESQVVRGSNEWVLVTMTFTPTVDVEAIALGPGCNAALGSFYYFLDDLTLNEASVFDAVPLAIDGDLCDDWVTLQSDTISGLGYQWYKDGVAISGATDPTVRVSRNDPGNYILRIDDGTDCQLSDTFAFFPRVAEMTIDTSFCVGSSIVIEGQTIQEDFLDTFYYSTPSLCDSLVIVRARQLDSTSATIDTLLCSGQSITIIGETFDQAGRFTLVTQNEAGCDSIIRLRLTITDTLKIEADSSVCAGETLMYRGRELNQAGEYVFDYSSAENCNVRERFQLTIRDTFRTIIDTTICRGEPIRANGQPVEVASDYIISLFTANGCDSTVIYRTSLYPTYDVEIDTFFCEGSTITLQGQEISAAGEYPFQLLTSNGCDSITTYTVREQSNYFERIDTTICQGERIVLLGDTIATAGQFNLIRQFQGCDSVVELNVRINQPYDIQVDSQICEGELVVWGGQSLSVEGTYPVFLTAENGCDSVVNLQLSVATPPSYEAIIVRNIDCHDNNSGVVRVNTTADASIVWEDGEQGALREDLLPGVYRFSLGFGPECSLADSIVLENPEPLQWELMSEDLSCDGTSGGSINVSNLSGGTGPVDIYINNELIPDFNGRIENLTTGRYQLRVEDENGCSLNESVQIDQALPLDVRIDASSKEVVVGDSVLLSVISNQLQDLVVLEWRGPEGECVDCVTWQVMPREGESEYFFFAEDENGCLYELSIILKATKKVYIPNVFSPNGDFVNDFFNLYDNGAVARITRFEVYDRWGELVYNGQNVEPSAIDQGWDGTFNGEPALPGVYVYFIEWENKSGSNEAASGDVTLIK